MSKKSFLAIFAFLITSTFLKRSTYAETTYKKVEKIPTIWFEQKVNLESIKRENVEIGEKLFFDKILSKDNRISCSSCHIPAFAFSNGLTKAQGYSFRFGEYNVPVVFNRINSTIQFWDGRVKSLSEQIFHPINNPVEMGLSTEEVIDKLNKSKLYVRLFGKTVTKEMVIVALESYVKSLLTSNSRYDEYVLGDKNSLSKDELLGYKLFTNKYSCNSCHSGTNFSNEQLSFRCGAKPKNIDPSIYGNVYKVPTLRNLKKSYPYFHNGNLKTLEEVLEYYSLPSQKISAKDKKLLIKFLNTLNSPVVLYLNPK